jgi:hypothetical protein
MLLTRGRRASIIRVLTTGSYIQARRLDLMDTSKNFFQLLGDWLAARQARRRETAVQSRPPRRLTTWLPTRGNVIFTLLMIVLLVLAQSVGALPLPATQHAPRSTSTSTIAYQGRLANAAGEPLTGTYNMIFRLYDAATGGTPLWSEQWTGSNGVKVSDGLFNVMLGSLTPLPISQFTSYPSLFLGITVGTDDEMAPRVQLGSVPFAVQALTVPDGSVTTAKIADGAMTAMKIADGAVTQAKLDTRLPRFLGQKTCDNCGSPTETNVPVNTWLPVKGANNQDLIEVTVTTQGGPVMALMTSRSNQTPVSNQWCGISVYQGNTEVRFAHIDGVSATPANDVGCSGAYVFSSLPAGTYTFRAARWTGSGGGSILWYFQRQITVFEF